MPAAAMVGSSAPISHCAPEASAHTHSFRVSPMIGDAIERRFSSASCRFTLQRRARTNAASALRSLTRPLSFEGAADSI